MAGFLDERAAEHQMSLAVTHDVRVEVESRFLPERSSVDAGRFFFAYTVRISNAGSRSVQLVARHWIVTDAHGRVEEVRGPGVVGEQPVLRPGEAFEYTSGCPLSTPYGTMHGTYQMLREDGLRFDAEIAAFALEAPTALRRHFTN